MVWFSCVSVGSNEYRVDPNVTATVTWYNSDVEKESFTLDPVEGRGIGNTVPTVNDSGEPDVCANDLIYPAYGEDGGNGKWMPTIYLEKGKSIAVEYQLSPNNANKNLPLWQTSYTGVDGKNATVAVTSDSAAKTLTITAGDKTGTVYVLAYRDEALTERWHNGSDHSADGCQITVEVYDPNDLSTVPFPRLSVDLGDVDLYVGDTYTVDMDAMKDSLDLPADVDKSTTTPFTDVVSGSYYENAVLWAVENGITRGTEDGTTFSPELVCDRAQIVTFIYRCMK